MFASSSKFIVPLFVCLSLFLAAAEASDMHMQRRDHSGLNARRLMKKRAPFPQDKDGDLLGGAVAGAAPIPTDSASVPASKPADTKSASSAPASSAPPASSAAVSSASASSASSASSSSSSSSSAASSTSAQTSTTDTPASTPAPGVKTVIVSGVTRTQTAPTESGTFIPAQNNALNTTSAKGITMTALIAVVASIGGVFIIWTIFRKWKLSSSKEFDRRLISPSDWQPGAHGDDDGAIPGSNRPRPPSVISNHSNAHGNNSAHGHNPNPFDDFDGPAKSSAPVGGYADLARGQNPQMQERYGAAAYGNNYAAGPVPLHHQGF
ncbi:hypothetical protein CPB83DRAFT_377223 [Crepidotus variabilis]|uniref:Uncharacterized protein n=1 Tax=Crepidotus variabilis TaxID=179855 RepID=A0A9P6JP50_9AGAR|nr:hypothetical protein CPB83DRAFT_377223 [Crepidotus variabilis]